MTAEALDDSQSLLVMLYHIAQCNNDSIPNKEWESEKLSTLLAEQIADNRKALAAGTAPKCPKWECAGRKQSLPEPADCNWPICGCDPYADKVMDALDECGLLVSAADQAANFRDGVKLGAAVSDELRIAKERLALVKEAMLWMEERALNSTSFGHHCHAYHVAARHLKLALDSDDPHLNPVTPDGRNKDGA